jgi:uncharacterized protein (TIGR03437 family)
MRGWGIQHRMVVLAGGLALASSMASGYYQWTFFSGRSGPFNPIVARFDLNSLPGGTIPYFISDQAPGPLVPGDSFTAVVSQIEAAANVWNGVSSSTARLSFGGLSSGPPQSAPGVDVVFSDEMPPGLLAQTYPTVQGNLSSLTPGTSFVKILRSRIQLRRDLTNPAQPSSSDAFFITVVHEFGHALGLQHSLTSGVMSTATTRAVTKAAPLAADDVAGVSLLYPAPGYLQNTGSIAGTVLQNGSGVNLASVVALSSNGIAISALANPDGTYRIGGVPPGQYYVYAQPLPPPQQGEAYPDNIIPPEDLQRNPFPANTSIDTEFFVSPTTGTHDWTQATPVFVNASGVSAGVNFSMQRRSGQTIPYMETLAYGANNQSPVYSPSLVAGSRGYLVFYAQGTTSGSKLAPGLGVSVIGTGAPARTEANTLQYWTGQNGFGLVVTDASTVSAMTPVALAVTLPSDLYVLPAAFFVVPGAAPAISGVFGSLDGQGNTTVSVAGTNLNPSTRVVFDGAAGTVLAQNGDGSLTVAAPPGAANYTAAVEALSNDGQTSAQQLGATPLPFTYAAPVSPDITVNYGVLSPGADSEIDIIAFNTAFMDGQVSVGFGSSDIVVKRMWVSPTRILLNVTVLPTAQPGLVDVTVSSGLQLLTKNNLLQVQVAGAQQKSLHVPVLNQATGLAGVPSPGYAVISTTGLPQNLNSWTLTVGGQPAGFTMVGGNQISFQVPSGLPLGAAVVALTSPTGDQIPQVVMQIDGPPPQVLSAANSAGMALDSTHAVRVGDTIILTVSDLFDGSTPGASPVTVLVGGVSVTPSAVVATSQAGVYQVQVPLGTSVPYGPNQTVQVGIGTRLSNPQYLSILPQ